jgi:membrane dipeptidase
LKPEPKSPVIDLHIDSFIATRIFGYDIFKRHTPRFSRGFFLGQVDLPRLKDAGFTGALWSITTNPFRTARGRAQIFQKNINRFLEIANAHSDQIKIISEFSDIARAEEQNQHAAFITIQGGSALDYDLDLITKHAKQLTAVTLMHLTHSRLGTSCTPYPSFKKRGLTKRGCEYVRALNQNKIFLDLAHADPKTFQDAMKVHDKSQPLLVSHTGINGIYAHWRNLSDEQLKQVADTGGVIGIIFERNFLGKNSKEKSLDSIVNHLEHVHKVVGEDFTALGSDWDGMIIPPKGLRSCSELPNLIRVMQKRGWNTQKVEKTLGLNFLRAFRQLRPQ